MFYSRNVDKTYVSEPLVEENIFIKKEKDPAPLPCYEAAKALLPQMIWDGRPDAAAMYDKAWELAFQHLRAPSGSDGMVSRYIDSAFNDFLFMWDAAFMTMFGKYGSHAFPFINTLDNFYAAQHMDGYICRAIGETARVDRFHRHDPSGTGPNILAWAELENYEVTGDTERLRTVFPPILAYHLWLREHRTWQNGAYWSTGWGCGMDNQPRVEKQYSHRFSHGHMVWLDATLQAVLSAKCLVRIAGIIGRDDHVSELREEAEYLTRFINKRLWDEKTNFYYDMRRDGSLNTVKSIGAYWALLADVVPSDRLDRFIAHLTNENEFKRPHMIPTLSANHPSYSETGSYWRGGVWAPTNYMVLKGLKTCGYGSFARDIALNHTENIAEVFQKTGTLWENYAPEKPIPGQPAKPDFVGWTGLSAIAIPIEFVPEVTLRWPASQS